MAEDSSESRLVGPPLAAFAYTRCLDWNSRTRWPLSPRTSSRSAQPVASSAPGITSRPHSAFRVEVIGSWAPSWTAGWAAAGRLGPRALQVLELPPPLLPAAPSGRRRPQPGHPRLRSTLHPGWVAIYRASGTPAPG